MTDRTLTPFAALLLRASAGALFLAHGLLKLLVFTPAGAAGYFASLGLPSGLAYLVIVFELTAGLALILGLWTRWVAAASIPLLLGAAWFAHGANGWMFANEGGGWEFPAFWAVAMMALAMLGDGAWSARPLLLRSAARS